MLTKHKARVTLLRQCTLILEVKTEARIGVYNYQLPDRKKRS